MATMRNRITIDFKTNRDGDVKYLINLLRGRKTGKYARMSDAQLKRMLFHEAIRQELENGEIKKVADFLLSKKYKNITSKDDMINELLSNPIDRQYKGLIQELFRGK